MSKTYEQSLNEYAQMHADKLNEVDDADYAGWVKEDMIKEAEVTLAAVAEAARLAYIEGVKEYKGRESLESFNGQVEYDAEKYLFQAGYRPMTEWEDFLSHPEKSVVKDKMSADDAYTKRLQEYAHKLKEAEVILAAVAEAVKKAINDVMIGVRPANIIEHISHNYLFKNGYIPRDGKQNDKLLL